MNAVVADGNLLLAVFVALAAGAVSFASPCVLPLVPGFLGYVTGLSGEIGRTSRGQSGPSDAARPGGGGAARGRVVGGAALFVVGFSTVFLGGTVLASAAGSFLVEHRRAISMVGGATVIALAFVFLGWGSQTSWSPRWRPAAGLAGAPLLGMVFAVGWAPCMGPTLAVIYTLATTTGGGPGTVLRGALLGTAYCVGLGVPFLLVAAGWSRAATASSWLRRHHLFVQRCGGGLLLVVGVLLLTGWWDALVVFLQIRLVSGFVPSL
ncbi:cytochrome c-type biogenesis protein [Austwickia chelonae]|uniref:Putative cytochrome c biogenesis protein n=1 Tax=Austwickia chelonae NBRC 105200 TaxID=1184607 RepID=K6V428_9MICO|nr:cytochrome c biogenesis CcdA family protein [Austwickia chelonae]GAB76893.1 putative cytochrome c biogenesis protein [Austwickia chelonae NBRC 105200]SEW32057.1 cytochrome c-type biogenesis protein [Austwickia chelonae]